MTTAVTNVLLEDALRYRAAGVRVVPSDWDWHRCCTIPLDDARQVAQMRELSDEEMQDWFSDEPSMCVLTGHGRVEAIEFHPLALFGEWRMTIDAKCPGLFERLYRQEEFGRGYRLVAYRTDAVAVEQVLAGRRHSVGRRHWRVRLLGLGSFFTTSSTGDIGQLSATGLDELPMVTEAERAAMIGAARALDDPEPIQVKEEAEAEPGLIPDKLLYVPGFIGELMDFCMETAPHPSQALAFCGALAMQAFLCSRRVRDDQDCRTNIYLLGLADSGCGKEHPRQVNQRLLVRLGMENAIGDRLVSGPGIEDALFRNQAMLFQTDEIDGILQSITKARDARHEALITTLLSMYSSAASQFPMRAKAGKEKPGVIDQPSLVLFGTAIPDHYYEALSERLLTNGFFARLLVVEAGPRSLGQRAPIRELPPRVMAIAKWWMDFHPTSGNMEREHPEPLIVQATDAAAEELDAVKAAEDERYAEARKAGEPTAMAVWARMTETVRRLSLIYACSENHMEPRISLAAVEWACKFVMHQTRRMLWMARTHVAENAFDAACQQVLQVLHASYGGHADHSTLLRKTRWSSKFFVDVLQTLIDRGEVEVFSVPQAAQGRPRAEYQLISFTGTGRLKAVATTTGAEIM